MNIKDILLNIDIKSAVETRKAKAIENAIAKDKRREMERDEKKFRKIEEKDKKDYFKYVDRQKERNIRGGMDFAEATRIENDCKIRYMKTLEKTYDTF